MNYKKILTMAGLSFTAAVGSVKAAPQQDQLSATSTPARVEHRVKASKGQMPGFILYPNFFPLDKRGEFDREKSLEMMKKIPLQELKDAFQEYNGSNKNPEKLLDLMSMGNPETKELLRQMWRNGMVAGVEKVVTPEQAEKRKEKQGNVDKVALGSSFLMLLGFSTMMLSLMCDSDKSKKSPFMIGVAASVVTVLSMITSCSSLIYSHCLGSDTQMTVEDVQKSLVDTHQRFFKSYRENQIDKQMTEKGVPVVAGKDNNEDNTVVTMTMGELRTLVERSYFDGFNLRAKNKLDSLIKR